MFLLAFPLMIEIHYPVHVWYYPIYFFLFLSKLLSYFSSGGGDSDKYYDDNPLYRYVLSCAYRVFNSDFRHFSQTIKSEKVSLRTHYLLGRTLLGTFLMSREQADNKHFVTGILISVPWNVTKACMNAEGSWLMRKMGEHLSYHLRNVVVKWVYFIWTETAHSLTAVIHSVKTVGPWKKPVISKVRYIEICYVDCISQQNSL